MYSRYDPTGRSVFRPLDDGGAQDAPVGDFVSVPDGYSGTALVRDADFPDFAEARGSGDGNLPRETSVAGEFSHGGEASGTPHGGDDGVGASEAVSTSVGAASSPARDGGILAALRGISDRLFGDGGILGGLDLGDVILLLIVALLFLEDGKPGDLVILAAVALFIGL